MYFSTGFLVDVIGYKNEGRDASFSTYKNTYKTTSLGIPLKLDYRFTDKPVTPFITGGFFPSVFYSSAYRQEITDADGAIITNRATAYFKRGAGDQLLMSMQLGGGMDLNFDRIKLQVYPLYEFGVLTRYQSIIYFHRMGAGVSLSYGF